jgi:hypothetical protein
MHEKRGHERRHHGIEVGRSVHDPDIGELGLRLAREMAQDALTQHGRGLRRVEQLDLGDMGWGQHAGPALLGFVGIRSKH